jgi:hypothetical protein
MRVESCHSDPWGPDSPAAQKIFEQQSDSDDLAVIQCGRDFSEREVGRDQRHGQLAARKQHREIFYAAAVGKELGLPRKLETNLVHSRLMNWSRHDSLNFTAEGKSGAFFQSVEGGVSRLGSGLT